MKLALTTSALVLCTSLAAFGQSDDSGKGKAIYRSNCAFCHGLTGQGGRGPNLVSRDQKPAEEIKRIVKNGVPGSTMPAFSSFADDEIASLVGFLKELAGTSPVDEKVTGDPAKGEAVYRKNGCAGCHQIGTQGSVYGPDLTRIGGARSLHYLQESIVEPNNDIAERYEGVTVVTKDGRKLTGVLVNQDTFSVQMRLPSQQFRSFLKDDVKEVIAEKNSLMPAYKSMPKSDLENLIAYLKTLRGEMLTGAESKKAKGIQ